MDGTAGSDIESGIGSSSATGVSDEGEGRNAGDHPISNYIYRPIIKLIAIVRCQNSRKEEQQ